MLTCLNRKLYQTQLKRIVIKYEIQYTEETLGLIFRQCFFSISVEISNQVNSYIVTNNNYYIMSYQLDTLRIRI